MNVCSPDVAFICCVRQTVKNKSATLGADCFCFSELVNFGFLVIKLLLNDTYYLAYIWILNTNYWELFGGNNVADHSCFSLQMCTQVPFLLIIGRFMGGRCKSFLLISESRISGLAAAGSGISAYRYRVHVLPGGRPPWDRNLYHFRPNRIIE